MARAICDLLLDVGGEVRRVWLVSERLTLLQAASAEAERRGAHVDLIHCGYNRRTGCGSVVLERPRPGAPPS